MDLLSLAITFLLPLNIEAASPPPAAKVEYKLIRIPGKGIEMEGYLFLPAGEGPFPAIISLPGGRGSRNVGKVLPFSKDIGSEMVRRGIAALVLDYSSPDRLAYDPETAARSFDEVENFIRSNLK